MKRFLPRAALPAAVIVLVGLAGCVTPLTRPSTGLTDIMERPAERQLLAGLRAYDDGQYPDAERELQAALTAGLASGKDRAKAHKLLAFIFCTSERVPDCEQSFRAARSADPQFALERAEVGHPLWGPVYRRVLPQ